MLAVQEEWWGWGDDDEGGGGGEVFAVVQTNFLPVIPGAKPNPRKDVRVPPSPQAAVPFFPSPTPPACRPQEAATAGRKKSRSVKDSTNDVYFPNLPLFPPHNFPEGVSCT